MHVAWVPIAFTADVAVIKETELWKLQFPKLLHSKPCFVKKQNLSGHSAILSRLFYQCLNCSNLIHKQQLLTVIHTHEIFFSLQYTCVEPTSSHKQHSLSHKKHKTFRLRAMASSYTFQKAVYQLKYQKQSWSYKSVCLVSFRCLLTVSSSVQSTGCTVPTSSQSPSLLRYSTVLSSPVISSARSSPSFLPNALRKSYLTRSEREMEVSSVTTVHTVACH